MSAAPQTSPPLLKMAITYEHAIRLVLNVRTMSRAEILGYFADEEHVRAGQALDDLVTRGFIARLDGVRGPFYQNRSLAE